MTGKIRHIIFICIGLLASSCSGSQFSAYQQEFFDQTEITESATQEIVLGNSYEMEEQHLRGINFDKGSNSVGNFRIDSVKVGERTVGLTDVIIPPMSALIVTVTYTPQNLETTVADYGGWETGYEDRWIPRPLDELQEEQRNKKFEPAIHRAILEAVYDKPREGIVMLELVGEAVPGPNGETIAQGAGGPCTPGDGTACYTGGFAMEIPSLLPGAQDLELSGPIRFGIAGGAATLHMDDFPPVLMYLRASEIPELPSGITASLIISGALGEVAEGTFDGSRLTLSGVDFRVRVVLGELAPEDVTPGLVAIVDFTIEDLELTTTEPLSGGNITLHIETNLGDAPSGNALFDQFLSGAKIIVMMQGQLAY